MVVGMAVGMVVTLIWIGVVAWQMLQAPPATPAVVPNPLTEATAKPPAIRSAPPAALPVIESVVVSTDQAVVKLREFHGEEMIVTLGTVTRRWSPGSVRFDHLFDVSIEWPWFRWLGAKWVIKSRHGIHADYLLDGPPGPMHGKMVFHAGTPSPEADGSYVIGEFKSETGVVLPIAVRLVSGGRKPASAQAARSPDLPARKDGSAIGITTTAPPPAGGFILINVSATGELRIAGIVCPEEQLDTRLKELASWHPESVTIRAEAGAPNIMGLEAACKAAGLDHVDLTVGVSK